MENLFTGLPEKLPSELTDVLVEGKGIRIERIVSTGHRSADGFWYDQDEHEWVVVLQGAATLSFVDGETIQLARGDHHLIPAHCRHRVEWTSEAEPTVWLAVFYH